jgi:hypothetical protein
MVYQPHDGAHAQVPQARQALVGPAPVGVLQAVGGDVLPQDGVADGRNAERGEALQVVHAGGVAIERHLVEVTVANTVDGALQSAPDLYFGFGPFG